MTKKLTYGEQLRHPNWQKRRLEFLERSDWTCEMCGDTESPLHAHHRIYERNRMAWEYEDYDLACLCDSCHSRWHEDRDRLLRIIMRETYQSESDEMSLAAVCAAYLRATQPPASMEFRKAALEADLSAEAKELFANALAFFEDMQQKKRAAYFAKEAAK